MSKKPHDSSNERMYKHNIIQNIVYSRNVNRAGNVTVKLHVFKTKFMKIHVVHSYINRGGLVSSLFKLFYGSLLGTGF